jgi:drug/metabolite transporter (DMT)-like permease
MHIALSPAYWKKLLANPEAKPGRTNFGIIFLVLSTGFTAVVDTTAKVLSADQHAMVTVWGYFLGILLMLLLYAGVKRIPLRRLTRTNRRGFQIMRAGLLVGTIGTLFAGLKYIPLADASAIMFMAPLFITALSVPILGEHVGPHRWAAVGVGLIGALIIIRPGGELTHWAAILPLISALSFAAFQIATRHLAATEDTLVTLFHTAVGGFGWSSAIVWYVWTPPTATVWFVFLAIGVLGVGAHFCIIRAYDEAQASLLAPFNYMKLIWIVALGYLVFDHIPDAYVFGGSGIIVVSGLYILYRESKTARRR